MLEVGRAVMLEVGRADHPHEPVAGDHHVVKSIAWRMSRQRKRMKDKVKKRIRMIEAKELLAKARSIPKTMKKKGSTIKMKLRRKRNPLNRRS